MARNPTEQRRDAANRNTPRDQGPQGRRSVEPRPRNSGTAGPVQQQQRTDRNRPFAPGEDGESH
jgi:hypothetical protein